MFVIRKQPLRWGRPAMMELSSEDSLRLNVLLANELEAIRIDESSMTLHGLSARGESVVRLSPNCRDEQYLRRVREMLSSHVLGSPGGYPVYLRRWTRMGQARDNSLEKLLLLGEPEAVVAVVHASGLTDQLAQRAWWAMPTADNARNMLARAGIATGTMGPVLAEYLVEYLPFEQEHGAMIDSIRLVLQPGLISDDTKARLWAKAKHKLTYYVGFLDAVPDELPEATPPHPGLARVEVNLRALAEADNLIAAQLLRLLGAAGQAYLMTVETVLRKPANQDVMVALVESLQRYSGSVVEPGPRLQAMDEILQKVERLVDSAQPVASQRAAQVQTVVQALPQLVRELYAMLVLSEVGERLVAPIFARTDAIGSVMRRRLEPVTGPLLQQIAILQGAAG